MRFQSTQASCGPAALRNALRARGVTRSEDELAQLCGFSPATGTPVRGMLRALALIAVDHPDITPAQLKESRPDIALLKLRDAHSHGLVVILCVDSDEHWVVSFGSLGDRIHVADSDDDEMVLHYTPPELIERWRGLGRAAFYGIVV